MPVSNLTLGFNYSLNDAKYTSWIGSDPYGAVLPGETAGGNIDLSDNPFENAPKHKVNLSASYRSEEHTSELQSLMRISYAVFCLKKKKYPNNTHKPTTNTHTIMIEHPDILIISATHPTT